MNSGGKARRETPRRGPARLGRGQGRPERKRPAKPTLPEERPRLARGVYADLKAASDPKELEDVARAVAAAGEAIDRGEVGEALLLLQWAKSAAARSGAVREALGIALYLSGDYAAAHSELQAYRRLTGRSDQNHLLADCARAAGRHEKVVAYVDELHAAGGPPDRLAEALIVLAGDRADRGDLDGAMAALEQADLSPREVQPWHPRLWYYAAELAERQGDRARARDYLEAIAAVEPNFLDVAERLAGGSG